MIAVLLPLWTSLLVRTYAWLVLLQRKGLINNWAIELGLWTEPIALVHNMLGTLIGTVHVMLPFLILPLYSSMRAIDRNYLRAAANLGASPLKTFWSVFFPLALPGMATGALIVFILCLGFYITPAVLGGGKVIMVSSRIANDIEIFFNWGAASALGVVLLALTALLIWIFMKLMKHDVVKPTCNRHPNYASVSVVALCRGRSGHDFFGHSHFVGGAHVFFCFTVFGVSA
jgi:ABC-type spermidine/putrescine transport system permease subunit I